MTPDQKRDALITACGSIPQAVCSTAETCPICGVCAYFRGITDEAACELYAEAVRRGVIKGDNTCMKNAGRRKNQNRDRNKILKEELSAIYSILDDIRYNRIN